MNHVLNLESFDTLNETILRISDASVYDNNLNVECPILSITLPGFQYSVQFDDTQIAQGFSLNLTACDLEIQTEDCGNNYKGLPDGIYIFKYSVSPSDVVYVEYNHLRVTKLMIRYQKILCELDLAACAPNAETVKKLKLLREIKMYIEAAKAKVDICHEPKICMERYT